MRGEIHEIVFELDGIPIGLSNEAQWREAIRRGELGRTTRVIVRRESEPALSQAAGEVPELQPLFEAQEAGVPEADGAAAAELETGTPEAAAPRPASRLSPRRRQREDKVPLDPHAIEEEVTIHRRGPNWQRPALLGLLLLALAGLAAAIGLAIRSKPVAGIEGTPQYYRVVSSADIRKGASLDADPVKRLTRDKILKGIPDARTEGRWLWIAEGTHAGRYFKMENLELANVTGNEIDIVN